MPFGEFTVARILYSILGRLLLFLRYWNWTKVKEVVESKYDNSFSMAGATIIWQVIAALLLIGCIAMLIATFYAILKFNFHIF